MEEGQRQVRPRGTANATELQKAQKKYKNWDAAANTEWQRLKDMNTKKVLTPEADALHHARWVHLSDLKNKKG